MMPPVLPTRQFRTLLDGSFLDREENVLVFGNPGSGKSHLLTALAQELVVGRERKMHFTRCALLMQDLLAGLLGVERTLGARAMCMGNAMAVDGLDAAHHRHEREDPQ
jgi:DNA replication protein DnaC